MLITASVSPAPASVTDRSGDPADDSSGSDFAELLAGHTDQPAARSAASSAASSGESGHAVSGSRRRSGGAADDSTPDDSAPAAASADVPVTPVLAPVGAMPAWAALLLAAPATVPNTPAASSNSSPTAAAPAEITTGVGATTATAPAAPVPAAAGPTTIADRPGFSRFSVGSPAPVRDPRPPANSTIAAPTAFTPSASADSAPTATTPTITTPTITTPTATAPAATAPAATAPAAPAPTATAPTATAGTATAPTAPVQTAPATMPTTTMPTLPTTPAPTTSPVAAPVDPASAIAVVTSTAPITPNTASTPAAPSAKTTGATAKADPAVKLTGGVVTAHRGQPHPAPSTSSESSDEQGSFADTPAGRVLPMPADPAPAMPVTPDQSMIDPAANLTATATAQAPQPAVPVTPQAATPTGYVPVYPAQQLPLSQQLAGPVLTLRATGDGSHSMIIALHPAELGPVDVHVRILGDAMTIQLAGGSQHSHETLRDALPQLRSELQAAGLSGVDLSLDASGGNQAGAESRWSGREQPAPPGPRTSGHAEPHRVVTEPPRRRGSTALDRWL